MNVRELLRIIQKATQLNTEICRKLPEENFSISRQA